jgi:hypothetical protein
MTETAPEFSKKRLMKNSTAKTGFLRRFTAGFRLKFRF